MLMLIYWSDLIQACQELLGFSWRVPSSPPRLSRSLPWQHPIWTHLFVKRIAEVKGIRQEGKITTFTIGTFGSSVGAGYHINLGPHSEFHLAELTIQVE